MEFRKICIIHLNQIGDLVFSLPLLRALKENYPLSVVHSILRPYLKDLLVYSPDVDLCLDRGNGLKSQMGLLREIRRNGYDLLITLSNSVECLFLTTLSRAKVKAGFACFPWDLRLDIKEKVEGHHSWYNNVKLLNKLGIMVKKKDYVGLLSLPPQEDSREGKGSGVSNFPEKYAVISPGTSARRRIKAWDEEKFGDLIIRLKEKYDLNPVLVGGEENKEGNDQVMKAVRDKGKKIAPMQNLAGRMGLRDLCHLIRKASLFVGVDSGIMHLASSLDIPVVGIFGPTDPFYVGPQNGRSRVVREKMECSPCYLKGCEDRTCMKRLEVEKVWDACDQLLSQ